jgi:hypothetical protein
MPGMHLAILSLVCEGIIAKLVWEYWTQYREEADRTVRVVFLPFIKKRNAPRSRICHIDIYTFYSLKRNFKQTMY